jgi:outer membrane biogenesis lipoprotein LolB
MKKSILVVATVASLLLSSCASTVQYNKIAQPNENEKEMATIYVLRPSSFGSAVKFKIYQEKLVGYLGPKSYLAWNVKPENRELTIISKSENTDMLTINPQAGKTYFIKQKVLMGVTIARTELEFLEEAEGREILKKLKAPKSKISK